MMRASPRQPERIVLRKLSVVAALARGTSKAQIARAYRMTERTVRRIEREHRENEVRA